MLLLQIPAATTVQDEINLLETSGWTLQMYGPSHRDKCDIKTPFQEVSELPCFAVSASKENMAPTCLLQPQISCVIYRAVKSTWSLQEAKRTSPKFHGPAQTASNSHIQGPACPAPPSPPSTFSYWKKPFLPFLFTSYKFTCIMLF